MTVHIPIGQGAGPSFIVGRFANRHGLIAGATGTGKSVTLATLAQGFSDAGVPVWLSDVKGDLAGLTAALPGRVRLDPMGNARLTVKALGPDLLARALNLSEAQAGVTDVAFAASADQGWPLRTLADFRDVLRRLAGNPHHWTRKFGLVTPASISAIQRALLAIDREGVASALGGPCFDVADLLTPGRVSVLDATRLMRSPTLYGAYLLFILTDLYDRLPEVGDLEKPRLVLFLDEAHLLFSDAPPALIQRVERIVRLIRSKGVGVYFATQSPTDLPSPIQGQLGNRIQHAMRAASVSDQRACRAAAETMPVNPKIDAATLIMTMGVGQALVSTIGTDGRPRPCDLVRVRMPRLPRLTPSELPGEGESEILAGPKHLTYAEALATLDSKSPLAPNNQIRGTLVLFLAMGSVGLVAWLAIKLIGHSAAIATTLGLLALLGALRMMKG